MNLDLIRLGIVYIHLLACCIALGSILLSDIEQAWMLWRDGHPTMHEEHILDKLHSTISYALLVLWLTGVSILWLDYQTIGFRMFENPKLQAKIFLVILLTLNGQVLSTLIFPTLKREGHLIYMKPSHALLAIFCGSVSAVTWLYAALLGVGRFLSFKYTLFELLWFYPVIILSTFSTITFLTYRKRKHLKS